MIQASRRANRKKLGAHIHGFCEKADMRTRTSRGKIGQGRTQLIDDESNFPSSRVHEALQRAITHATEYLNGLDERSVAPTVTLDELRSRLGSALPEAGIDPCEVIDDLVAHTQAAISVRSAAGFSRG
jgi:hypothetical protein